MAGANVECHGEEAEAHETRLLTPAKSMCSRDCENATDSIHFLTDTLSTCARRLTAAMARRQFPAISGSQQKFSTRRHDAERRVELIE
jgi:hypothetical protein